MLDAIILLGEVEGSWDFIDVVSVAQIYFNQ